MGKRRDNQGIRSVAVSVDVITDTAVKVVMRKEGLSYSAAICALATNAAIHDDDCMVEIRKVVAQRVGERLQVEGWHPGLSAAISREMVTGHKEKLSWN